MILRTPGTPTAKNDKHPMNGEPAKSAQYSTPRAPARWAVLVATGFGVGRLRPAPGTWASAITVILWWLFARLTPLQVHFWLAIFLALLTVIVGIPAATRVALGSGQKDPQFVVIDEVAGQLIAMIAVPVAWKSLLISFILFRGFDIVKPPPIRSLEQLPGGWGVVLDDVAAGFCALGIAQALLHFGILLR